MSATRFATACLLLGVGVGAASAWLSRDPVGGEASPQAALSIGATQASAPIADGDVQMIAQSVAGTFAAQFDTLRGREFDSESERGYLLKLLLARWIDLDPSEAGAKLVADDYLAPEFCTGWGLRDVSAALEVALAYEDEERRASMVAATLRGLVERQPERVLELLEGLPENMVPHELLAEVFMMLAGRDPAAALAEAERWGRDALLGAAAGWARLDPQAALAWVEDGHGEFRSAVVREWAKNAPSDAIAYLGKQPNPMADRDLAGEILERLGVEGEIAIALEWVQKHAISHGTYLAGRVLDRAAGEPLELWHLVREQMHGMSQRDGLELLGRRWSGAEFEQFFAAASEFSEEERSESMGMMGAWAKVRFHEALAYAQAIEDPEARRTSIRAVLESAFSSDAMGIALGLAPEYREHFGAGPEYSDAELATAFLDGELRDPSLSVRSTASRFWLVAPDEGARWIASHPRADDANVGKYAQEMTRMWSDEDPQGASGWLATLEPSAARDFAALGLVEAVAPFDPSAAFEWAAAIESGEPRRAALDATFRGWMWSDRAAAEAALAGSGLAEEEKVRLLGLGEGGDEK